MSFVFIYFYCEPNIKSVTFCNLIVYLLLIYFNVV